MLRRPNLNKVAKIKTSSCKNQKSSKMDPQIWHKIAAISGVAAVGLGAYGAHGFKPQNPTYKEVWNTASLYHLVHTAALLAAPTTKHPNIFGGLLTGGIMAFSGTCYAVALLEDRKYSTLAPLGGFAFIAAWASLLF
ncbi:transmembrane protein 256 homolog [Solanum pennellii]|uniref:Transmembrane protein 256 homolog n=1 Tax=Solanum pennellii TaxID=28526 RepID=A0ABM1H5B0_SOLPN|nr:transmembrane protein 256 homolog [Solanum pennellii]